MGLFRKLASFIGIAKEEDQHDPEDDAVDAVPTSPPFMAAASTQHLPRRGFSVPVEVPVEKAPPPPPPLLMYCPAGDGGIQGLRWYARRLRMDEDGDVADEFLDEVLPEMSTSLEVNDQPLPRFKVKYSTKPARVKNLALLPNGKIQHLVENEGKLEWI